MLARHPHRRALCRILAASGRGHRRYNRTGHRVEDHRAVLSAPPPPPTDPDFEAVLAYINSLVPPGQAIAYGVLTWAYFVLRETSAAQATVGKRLLGIRVSTGTADG